MLFRETPWCQQAPPPWSFPGTIMRGFALHASFNKLFDWCEDMLDGASDSSFVPALPIVFLYVAHYPKMIADAWADRGFSVQNEYFFMFPVIRSFGGILPLELGWTIPFIGVDNGTSAISGQMVVGLPKTLGVIQSADVPGGGFSAKVSMDGLATHSPASQQALHLLLEARASMPDSAAASLAASFPGGALSIPAIDALIPPSIRDLLELPLEEFASATFALRQVRDCGAPTQAALSDVIRMRFKSENEQDIRLWQNAEIDLFDDETFPITATLGLTGGMPLSTGGTRYTPIAAWGLTADLSMSAAPLA